MLQFETQLKEVLAATQKDLPPASTVTIEGQAVKVTDIVTQLQSWIALYDKLSAAAQAAATARQAVSTVAPAARTYIVNYLAALKVALGSKNPLLQDFGLSISGRKTPSAQVTVIAKAKALATRKARGTMGKKERQKVTANGSPTLTVTSPSGVQLLQSSAPPPVNAPATTAAAPPAGKS